MKRTTLQSKSLPKSHPMRRKAERRAIDAEQERKENGQFGSGGSGPVKKNQITPKNYNNEEESVPRSKNPRGESEFSEWNERDP